LPLRFLFANRTLLPGLPSVLSASHSPARVILLAIANNYHMLAYANKNVKQFLNFFKKTFIFAAD
jgi:hypothetical protein